MNKYVKEWLEAAAEALVIIFILYFVFWPVKVEGISMEHTLFDGDRIVISRAAGLINGYREGDIVVLSAEYGSEEIDLVKRIVAMGGDHLVIKDGAVRLNETLLEEPYCVGETDGSIDMVIPEDFYFVMGDNRQRSMDSRSFGIVSKKQISGKVILRWYPIKNFKTY